MVVKKAVHTQSGSHRITEDPTYKPDRQMEPLGQPGCCNCNTGPTCFKFPPFFVRWCAEQPGTATPNQSKHCQILGM